MQVRSGGAAGFADIGNELALADHRADLHRVRRAMQERAVQPHPVVDHQQLALKAEWALRGKRHHPVSRSDERRATGPGGDIEARVIAARRAVVDPLRPELAR